MDALRGSGSVHSPAPWTRPGVPKSVARPSWMSLPRPVAIAPAERPPSVPPVSAPVDSEPSMRSVLPSMVPPSGSMRAMSRPSMAAIQTRREVELESEAAALRVEVARLAQLLATVRARVLEESEPEIVRLAVAVAERVVGREVSLEPSLIVSWIKEGMAVLPGVGEIVVTVASDVAEALSPDPTGAMLGDARLVVDPALPPGSCRVHEGAMSIEVGKLARLASIADALGVDHAR